MKHRRGQAGVTLMELMIAVSLVSFLSLGLMLAIRVGLSAMEKSNQRFTENRKVASVNRIIESQISGMMPVEAECRGGGGAAGKFVFFEGKPQMMRFASTYSLQESSRGYPRILVFQVIPGARQGVRLVVQESVYPGPIGAGLLCTGLANRMPVFAETSAVRPDSFVLADNLAYCRILYRETLPPPEIERWLPAWINPERMPSGIRIEMAPLNPDPARPQVSTVTVPVRITKWLMAPYYDQ